MKIRSITYFLNPGYPVDEEGLRKAGKFITSARPAFESAGYEVQTARLASVPYPLLLPDLQAERVVDFSCQLERDAQAQGYDYISIGPALPSSPQSYPLIPEVLAATKNVFLSGQLTIGKGCVSLPAVQLCAEVIQRSASISSDGFANLRFAALANVPAGAPFFPAAYHAGDKPCFALATEAADLAVEVFSQTTALDEAGLQLTQQIEAHAGKLALIGNKLEQDFGLSFGGIDFTLAPFPEVGRSIGTAIELLGVPAVGFHGSLAATAFLTSVIDRAKFKRTGFCGIFLPVLEDAVLASRAAEGKLSVNDLLLYSAVCGTGLDTIPLGGNVTVEELNGVLLDLAVLAVRLDKPLTARLMPIPGKKAGDLTGFDFAYFANSRILDIKACGLVGLLVEGDMLRVPALRER